MLFFLHIHPEFALFFFLPGAEQSVDLHTIAAWPLHQWWFPMLAGCL